MNLKQSFALILAIFFGVPCMGQQGHSKEKTLSSRITRLVDTEKVFCRLNLRARAFKHTGAPFLAELVITHEDSNGKIRKVFQGDNTIGWEDIKDLEVTEGYVFFVMPEFASTISEYKMMEFDIAHRQPSKASHIHNCSVGSHLSVSHPTKVKNIVPETLSGGFINTTATGQTVDLQKPVTFATKGENIVSSARRKPSNSLKATGPKSCISRFSYGNQEINYLIELFAPGAAAGLPRSVLHALGSSRRYRLPSLSRMISRAMGNSCRPFSCLYEARFLLE